MAANSIYYVILQSLTDLNLIVFSQRGVILPFFKRETIHEIIWW